MNSEAINKLTSAHYDINFWNDNYGVIEKNRKYGVVDKQGNILVPLLYDNLYVEDANCCTVELDRKYGIIDINGNIIVSLEYDSSISFFKKKYAVVYKNKKYGIIDKQGKLLLPLVYDNINSSTTGPFFVITKKEKLGLIHASNFSVLLDCTLDKVGDFYDGDTKRLLAIKQNGKWGFLHPKSFKIVISFQYENVSPFLTEENLDLPKKILDANPLIAIAKKDGAMFYINPKNEIISTKQLPVSYYQSFFDEELRPKKTKPYKTPPATLEYFDKLAKQFDKKISKLEISQDHGYEKLGFKEKDDTEILQKLLTKGFAYPQDLQNLWLEKGAYNFGYPALLWLHTATDLLKIGRAHV